MKDLSIVIVSYNTKVVIKECLLSISQNKPKNLDFEIIVVDNNSKDGSLDLIKREFPNVKLIENKKNLGFSKANNIGVKSSNGEYILFLNSDTVVYNKTLDAMAKFMNQHQDTGAATCKIVLPNGTIDDACHRGFPTPWNAFCHFLGLSKVFKKSKIFSGYSLGYLDRKATHEIDACAGAFIIVRREAGDQVGWWDEDYFWYGEDLDFCYRLKKKGWRIYYVADVSTLHYKGVSAGIRKDSEHITTADFETRKLATKARFDAMRIFYRKHYKNRYPGFINWLILQGINIKYLIAKRP